MGEYKEIGVENTDIVEDFELIIEEDNNENEIETEVVEEVVEKAPVEKPTATSTKKPSRAEKRIKELHTSVKERDQRLAEVQAELEALKKNQSETTKSSKEDMKGTLEGKINTLNESLIKAIEEGDSGRTVAIQNELLMTSNKLYDLKKDLDSYKPYEPKKIEQVQQPKVSEKAIQWIEDNPDFKTDEIFQAAALAVNRKLINSGWDPDSDEFYEEVTEQLKPRFPEKFGVDDENSVELETDTKKSSSVKTQNKTQRHTEQTVSGASRTPSTTSDGKSTNSKKNTITLTQEEVRLAKKWNMTPEQYAKRKLAIQNKERGEYTEINLGA